jgi:PKHD-type hydroxylase
MKGEWCYFKSHIDSNVCDYIVQTIIKRPAEEATIGLDGKQVDNDMRKSKIRFVHDNDSELSSVFDLLWKTAIWANKDWFNFHLTKLDYIQIAEYDSSYKGEYKQHQDVFWINNTEYHRKLSCIIQLTDPSEYEGGDLTFYNLNNYPDEAEVKQKGTIIFFPSFVYHAALPVTKGTRYSIAAWFDGPKWK